MIEAKEVNFAYRRGIPVLNDINCKIEDGDFVALLGHNGSGKTTLLSILAGLDSAESGEVWYNGEQITANRLYHYRRNQIGIVFQQYNLINYLTGIEIVDLEHQQLFCILF